ncbi:MAG TPA: ribonuclease H [Gemmatimonadaceae bacterium]|nr:ribonuclease H [Gemmatimonadaceae bacterium]
MTRAKAGDLVAIYADESCIGNGREGDNPGGAAGVIEWLGPDASEPARADYWISEPATTNNRMALRSVIEAFRALSRRGNAYRVVFVSDSKYIVDGMTQWVRGWQARDWKRKGGPILNLELWKEAVKAVEPHECQWKWVRGHAGQPQNEYANFLATRAAADQTDSGGLRHSGFDSWMEAQKTGRLRLKDTAPFPDSISFQPGKRAWTT